MLKKHKLAIVFSSVLFVSTAYAADRSYDLSISAQPLSTALRALAEQSGLEVVYESALVAGMSSPELRGTLTAEQAVNRMLAGTGLKYRVLNERAIAITNASPATPMAVNPTPPAVAPRPGGGADADVKEPEGDGEGEPSAVASTRTLDEVVVTGTHIRGVGETGSPMVVMTREKID